MSEENVKTETPEVSGKKKPGKWFGKIPKEMILSPGGIILLLTAILIEVVDFLIPPTGVDVLIELIPEIIFAVMLTVIAGVPLVSQIVPILIERVPFVSDIVPTFLFYFI